MPFPLIALNVANSLKDDSSKKSSTYQKNTAGIAQRPQIPHSQKLHREKMLPRQNRHHF